jgi:hypothetical protein
MFVSNGNAGPTCSLSSSLERSKLISPAFSVPSSGTTILGFDTFSRDEAGTCIAGGMFDGKDVGLSTDGGATYALLNDQQFDISAFGGATVQIVFAYDTIDANTAHTFAVDNVVVTALPPDGDGDDLSDACDCAPLDPENPPAAEVSTLHLPGTGDLARARASPTTCCAAGWTSFRSVPVHWRSAFFRPAPPRPWTMPQRRRRAPGCSTS